MRNASSSAPPRPPVLLVASGDHGALAAARCLGRRGVSVTVASHRILEPAAWSHHATRARCPKVGEALVEWLRSFGARWPGHVLVPATDDLAWLFAANAPVLAKWFRLDVPGPNAVFTVLDKKRLMAACVEVGIQTPVTWFPSTTRSVESIADEARFPLVVKPRTHVFSTLRKGRVVESARELLEAHADFVTDGAARSGETTFGAGDIGWPMVQAFHTGKSAYSISGYCSKGAGLFVVRACSKVLQWPRRLGIGIGFEDAPVDALLAEHVRRLCRRVGFHGVFEVEFIRDQGAWLLIDFNPRLFGQIGFDVARGLPSPYLAYLEACGDDVELRAEIEIARSAPSGSKTAFVNDLAFAWSTALDRLLRKDTSWNHWRDGLDAVDATWDAWDRWPGYAAASAQLLALLRHPRSVMRAALHGS